MESQDELIKQLFEQVTVKVSETSNIKAIGFNGFDYAIRQMMQIAYINGQSDCIESVKSSMKGLVNVEEEVLL
jgi:hypothetical protein